MTEVASPGYQGKPSIGGHQRVDRSLLLLGLLLGFSNYHLNAPDEPDIARFPAELLLSPLLDIVTVGLHRPRRQLDAKGGIGMFGAKITALIGRAGLK